MIQLFEQPDLSQMMFWNLKANQKPKLQDQSHVQAIPRELEKIDLIYDYIFWLVPGAL